MRPVLSSLSLLLFFGFAGEAEAKFGPGTGCLVDPPIWKKIKIRNNSPETIFPFIQVPIYDAALNDPNLAKSTDLWMQVQCRVVPADSATRTFNTTVLYRAWINDPVGIAPNQEVTVHLPFYTRLKPDCAQGTSSPNCISADNLGKVPDQFIDWFNSARIYFFYGNVARTSAFLDVDASGVYPKPVNFGNNIPFQKKPMCSPACQITFIEHKTNPRDNIPFQLQEYTFAAAEGPKPGGSRDCSLVPQNECFRIDPDIVNYNISSLDSVYLPVAMGPILQQGQDSNKTKYIGDGDTVAGFHDKLKKFANDGIPSSDGSGWPFYIPLYFANVQPPKDIFWPPIINTTLVNCAFILPFINPLDATQNAPLPPYPGSKLPGTTNMLVESFRKIPPSPPLLSSQPANFRTIKNFDSSKCGSVGPPPLTFPALGKHGKAVIDLWNRCLGLNEAGDTCNRIRMMHEFFLRNYNNPKQVCKDKNQNVIPKPKPDAVAIMVAVYGWVPIRAPLYPGAGETQCQGGPLVDTPGLPSYATVNEQYCELQYNYLTGVPQKDVFSPYTQLIHTKSGVPLDPTDPNPNKAVGLGSTAYAFSIDDELSFRSLPAPGIIITVGGTTGLENTVASPVPESTGPNKFHCKVK